MIGQYAHGNEPSHHIAYLYAFSDKPQRAGELVSQICRDFLYQPQHWHDRQWWLRADECLVHFCHIEFYPVNPSSGEYVIGKPQVQAATVYLDKQKPLRIRNNNSTTIRKLNDQPINGYTIKHQTLLPADGWSFNGSPLERGWGVSFSETL